MAIARTPSRAGMADMFVPDVRLIGESAAIGAAQPQAPATAQSRKTRENLHQPVAVEFNHEGGCPDDLERVVELKEGSDQVLLVPVAPPGL